MRTRVTDLLGIRHPIVQGGLQHLALPELCGAVSDAGALGQLTASAFETPDQLVEAIEQTRDMTDSPFAVNFALGRWSAEAHLAAAIEAGIRIYSFTGGNPEPLLKQLSGVDAAVLVLVASARQARKAESLGASAVIAVGVEGGGHIGRDDVGTMVLVPRVVDAVRIPVLASGGIVDARGLAAALALGAEGIEMGTRFVATRESPAHPAYKQALVDATEADTVVIERSVGRPGRVLAGPWADRILEMERQGVGIEELLPLIRGEINYRAARDGRLEEGFVWAGQGTGLIHDVPAVGDLLERMIRGAEEIIASLMGGRDDRLRQYPGSGQAAAQREP